MTESSSASSGPAVLEAEGARIAIDDAVAIDALSFATRGERVVCAGSMQPLMAALSGVPLGARRVDDGAPAGEARVTRGVLRVLGHDVARAEHHAIAGVAPLDPPLPRGYSVRDYIAWSARLAGASPRQARELARAAIERAGLAPGVATRQLSLLPVPERRVVVLASAAVTLPAVIVAEAPLSALDSAPAAFVFRALAALTEGRAAIVSAARLEMMTPEGSLARGATDLVVLAGGELVVAGAPGDILSGASLFAVRVRANSERFRDELATRGIALRGGPQRFSIALPAGLTTTDVLSAASAAAAPVVELSPLVG